MSSGPATFSYEKNKVFDELVQEQNIFESNIKLLVFCACLGYNRDRRVYDHEENAEIRWRYVERDPILPVMSASLAYAATDEPDALNDVGTQIRILVQFGAGGSRLIETQVLDQPGENLDLLIELLQEERDSDKFSDRVDIISQIEEEVSSL